MKALFKSNAILTIVCASIMAYTTSCTDEITNGNKLETDQLCFDVSLTDKNNSGTDTRSAEGHQAVHYEARHLDNSELWLITSTEESIDSTLFEQSDIQTRGTTIGNDNFYDSFNIYSYVYDNEETWNTVSSDDATVYINNASVTKANNYWHTTPDYFWPGSSYKMAFFAYAPNDGSNNPVIDCKESLLTYSTADDVTNQKDLIIATETDVDGGKRSYLPLTFKHILTAVKVKVTNDFTETIKKIELQGVYGSGTYVNLTNESNKSLTKTWADDSKSNSGTSGNTKSYAIDIESYSGTTTDENGNTEVSGDGNNATFFMIPQTLGEDAKLVITLEDGSTMEASLSGKVWPEGHTVTYILSGSNYIDYEFEVTSMNDFNYLGGTNSYSVTSYRTRVSGETATNVAAAWTAEFVEIDDNGEYNVIEQPEWLTSFTTSGNGKAPEGDDTGAVSYNATVAEQTDKVVTDPNKTLQETAAISTADNPYNLSNSNGGSAIENTANCYVVNAAGTYSLPLVYGNAIKNGTTNASAYSSSVTNVHVLKTLVNHLGNGITSPYIYMNEDESGNKLAADNAVLIWQDAQSLVTDIKLSDDKHSLIFTIEKDNIQQGNAVIAVRDKDNNVLWSWHIWVTNYKLGENLKTITSTADNNDYRVMPINIGWCASSSTTYPSRSVLVRFTQTATGAVRYITVLQNEFEVPSAGNQPYYQWGRKDPFPPSNGTSFTNKTCYDNDGNSYSIEAVQWTTGLEAVTNGILNPGQYYKNTEEERQSNELYFNYYYNLWTIDNASAQNTGASTSTKTVYDPCPVGYKVPATNTFKSFTIYTGLFFYEYNNSATPRGWYFPCKNDDGGDGTIYFPILGCRSFLGGYLADVSNGYYWEAYSSTETGGLALTMAERNTSESNVLRASHRTRATGHPIRAVVDE
ncbi:MAG: fimbrillin family protein [Prevotellaceae bacterium]|nr:fimbrillin family protein [Prevotellaceae bacterium]